MVCENKQKPVILPRRNKSGKKILGNKTNIGTARTNLLCLRFGDMV